MWSDDFGLAVVTLTLCGCTAFLTMLTLVWTCWSIYRLDRAVGILAVSRHSIHQGAGTPYMRSGDLFTVDPPAPSRL